MESQLSVGPSTGSALNCSSVMTLPPRSDVAWDRFLSSMTSVSPALIAVSAILASRDCFKDVLFVQLAQTPQRVVVKTIFR